MVMAAWGVAGNASATLILDEPFTYPDGSLTNVSAGLWLAHSATAGSVDVVSGQARLTASDREDVNCPLGGGPYTNGTLYASFTVNFSALPSAAGNFFAHFNAGAFRGRVFATTAGAPAGKFRLGIANGASSPSPAIESDLSPGQDYGLVLRVGANPTASTLWIDPSSEASLSERADAVDATTPVPLSSFALRQDSGIGTLTVDGLKIGTTFADVVAEAPIALEISQTGEGLQISWPASPAGYVLQSTAGLPSGWSDNVDQGTAADGRITVTVPSPVGTQFFRLAK
jgi:hypothetical protein